VLIGGVVGYYVGFLLQEPILGLQYGLVCSLILILIEKLLAKVSVRGLSSLVFGLLLGVLMAKLISNILHLLPLGSFVLSVSEIILTLIFSYFGAVIALRGKDEFNIVIPYMRFKRVNSYEGVTLLDTSAIIDGRVKDIYKVKFLSGRLLVPNFVLEELQGIADSDDEIKRQKGRRGMEYLKEMRSDRDIDIAIHYDENREFKEGVDIQLIHLAKLLDARICTTDFNLSSIASFQGVDVLNINELTNVVQPMVNMGDRLRLKLVKKGKESHQAVGFLNDGTMVVVSQAANFVGKEKQVVVTSIIQKQSGKIVFGKLSQ
jgi:uncharacterized protein YacL